MGESVMVLLIEDDEDDYVLVRSMLSEASPADFVLEWVTTYEEALEEMNLGRHDAYLLDYRLGEHNGLELLKEAVSRGCRAPIVFLTGQGDYRVDIEAMRAGAADYLVKDQISAPLLERSIRYAIERHSAQEELRKYRDELEELVLQRTAQLENVNSQLRLEIAERKRADEALRETQEQYRILVQSALDIIYTVFPDGTISSLNPAFEMITGWPPREWIGRHFAPLLHPDDVPLVESRIELLQQGKAVPPAEIRILSKSGECLILEFRTTPQLKNGKVIGVLGVARDISKRKRAEDKVIEQNEFLNHVLESLTHPFYVLDASDHTITMANSAAISGSVAPKTTCYALTHNKNEPCNGAEHLCPLQMIKKTKKPVTLEHVHCDKEGNPRNVEIHAYPILDGNGNVSQVIEYSFDITDRKKMEEALRLHAEKIKLFAYSISHDIKSPVIGINGLTRLLNRQYSHLLDERGKKYCEQILKASEQVVTLVEEINLFIKMKEIPVHFEEVRPREIFQVVKDEFRSRLESRNIRWVEPEAPLSLRAERTSLLRVFRNLVENALKYGGEDLSKIEIGYREDHRHHIFFVSDNGVGIKPEDSGKIFGVFERNESSKGVEGTGLGLAIVKEISRRHRGNVWVESMPDRGATFYISISKHL
jgi:PAS domain S-box-containing protein